jgi:leucyl/phenylalanyl-tRNA--protein transferase
MTTLNLHQSRTGQLYWVADNVIAAEFPPVNRALRDPDGLLAIGGDLSPDRLLSAYRQGIFPWYSRGQPILWWSPNPRCVLELENLKISRSLHKTLRKGVYQVSFNRCFDQVIRSCATPRRGQEDTWLTYEMSAAYRALHQRGDAVSVESWFEGKLAGGLYGLAIGRVFFGESMFSSRTDASKVALVHLVRELERKKFRIIDCQVHSRHLQSLGATPMPRDLFVNLLQHYCTPAIAHAWPATVDPA